MKKTAVAVTSQLPLKPSVPRTRVTQSASSPHIDEPTEQLPHERDQTADAHRDAPQPAMDQAYKDVRDGQQDTDRRSQATATYNHHDPRRRVRPNG